MRKYSVTLLIIDQRPSSIDAEVLSQLGTRITALLSDERDIDAVFTGTRASHMRQTLATLDTRQEVLIFGHAVPMEVVSCGTREFDERSTAAWARTPPSRSKSAQRRPAPTCSGSRGRFEARKYETHETHETKARKPRNSRSG